MVTINGEKQPAAGMSLLCWLEKEGYAPDTVVVERNLEIIPREALGSTVLAEGDSVEILRFVGGG